VQECIKSIGANLQAWSSQIKYHRTKEPPEKQYLTNIWLTYLETYFREEAFDVHRKELVTNGRNYPFLLIATLTNLYNQLPKNNYLHYYSVTPVNPKDWYNWPHGRMTPKCYYEEDYLSLFHRSLQEFLLWTKQHGSKLTHARFILTRANKDVPENIFGWSWDTFENLSEDLRCYHILNVSTQFGKRENYSSSLLDSLNDYYINVADLHENKVAVAVPLHGNHWESRLEELHKKYKDNSRIPLLSGNAKAIRRAETTIPKGDIDKRIRKENS
jgi:hypothetical protein